MENQLYIPNQVLSSVTKENAEAIRENVGLINKLVAEFYSENETKVNKAEHIIYMLLILEKMIYAKRDATAELTKIQIIRKDILERLRKDPKTKNYRSNLLYPLTKPEVTDVDISSLLEATFCGSTDPLTFGEVKDMVIPEDCIIYKMYSNSDFYYYDPNKGFVGTPIADKAVTEDLIHRTQYIRKVLAGGEEFDEDITMEIIGDPWKRSTGAKGTPAGDIPIFFILNDTHFAELRCPQMEDNELFTSRYNIFSILPVDYEFKNVKPQPAFVQGVLSDLFAKKKMEDLFFRILIKREKTPRKVLIVNTLTEIFLQKLNRREDLKPEAADKIWNKAFFYSKQHIYMLYFERILGLLDNARGVTSESISNMLAHMVCSDDTSNLASIMSELKK